MQNFIEEEIIMENEKSPKIHVSQVICDYIMKAIERPAATMMILADFLRDSTA